MKTLVLGNKSCIVISPISVSSFLPYNHVVLQTTDYEPRTQEEYNNMSDSEDSSRYVSDDEFGSTVTGTTAAYTVGTGYHPKATKAYGSGLRRSSSSKSVGGNVEKEESTEDYEVDSSRRVFQRLPAWHVMGKPCAVLAFLLLALSFAITRSQTYWVAHYSEPGVQELATPSSTLCLRFQDPRAEPLPISTELLQHFHARKQYLEALLALPHTVLQGAAASSMPAGSTAAVAAAATMPPGQERTALLSKQLPVFCAAWEAKAFNTARLPAALQEWAMLPMERLGSCLCHDLTHQSLQAWCNTTALFTTSDASGQRPTPSPVLS